MTSQATVTFDGDDGVHKNVIRDGGANDADGVRNFVVKDPGGLAVAPESETVTQTSNDSRRVGTLSLWFILLLSLSAVCTWRLRIS
jgi:hypothetical protein